MTKSSLSFWKTFFCCCCIYEGAQADKTTGVILEDELILLERHADVSGLLSGEQMDGLPEARRDECDPPCD